MGMLSEALTHSAPGCGVIQKLAEIDVRDDIDDEDKKMLREALGDREFPPLAISKALRGLGISLSREIIFNHREHGDCTKTRKSPSARTDGAAVFIPPVARKR